ncbi:DUF6516 family protein [Priestia megaterium]|uniref:DUF6516 family protein n=1 Tax=Priestia megaterium TaxID=1404 RepID=UPI001ADFCB6F|nr:DUF6516 family protein [Priestia megaterium]
MKTLGIKRTNFKRLKLDFNMIIEDISMGAYKKSPVYHGPNVIVQSEVIEFHSALRIPHLYCVEYVDKVSGEIIEYFYDWEGRGEVFMKFHAHYHPPGTPAEITKYDPFHLHRREHPDDKQAKLREKDITYQSLFNVLVHIKDMVYMNSHLSK